MTSQIYYHSNRYDKPIKVTIDDQNNVTAQSSYWDDEFGKKENSEINFNIFGQCTIYDECIKFNDSNFWHKDNRKNILFIGANDMCEINKYVNEYNNGLFIEAIDYTYDRLKQNLSQTLGYNTNYIPINSLVTSKKNEEHTFYIFNNNEASSSIYEPNWEKWIWVGVNVKEKIQLISNTIEDVLLEQNWENKKYDVVLDVQGAELEVLKGFGKNNLNNIKKLTVEISTKQYYIGGVLWDELHKFLLDNNFILTIDQNRDFTHCDVVYMPANP